MHLYAGHYQLLCQTSVTGCHISRSHSYVSIMYVMGLGLSALWQVFVYLRYANLMGVMHCVWRAALCIVRHIGAGVHTFCWELCG